MLTADEFKNAWALLIVKYNLKTHPFMTQIYKVHKKWAKPYFEGVFCAKMAKHAAEQECRHDAEDLCATRLRYESVREALHEAAA
jgi:hypothetical protein